MICRQQPSYKGLQNLQGELGLGNIFRIYDIILWRQPSSLTKTFFSYLTISSLRALYSLQSLDKLVYYSLQIALRSFLSNPLKPTPQNMASTHQLRVQELFSVKGYVCVVTGGGTGIGLMATQALAANGMYCVLLFYDVTWDKRRVAVRWLFFLPSHIDKFAITVIIAKGKRVLYLALFFDHLVLFLGAFMVEMNPTPFFYIRCVPTFVLWKQNITNNVLIDEEVLSSLLLSLSLFSPVWEDLSWILTKNFFNRSSGLHNRSTDGRSGAGSKDAFPQWRWRDHSVSPTQILRIKLSKPTRGVSEKGVMKKIVGMVVLANNPPIRGNAMQIALGHVTWLRKRSLRNLLQKSPKRRNTLTC